MRLLILSDIHGNLSALESVWEDATSKGKIDGVILLGDNIDYGMRSNEVISFLMTFEVPVIASIWGNHENAVLCEEYSHFSSERGVQSAKRTRESLSQSATQWLNNKCDPSGICTFEVQDKRVLAIHGNLRDPLWGKLSSVDVDPIDYEEYDVVLSGHNHIPHCFDVLVPADDPAMRNHKVITFINPGSVGQPRNHDPRASYCIWDTDGGVYLGKVEYDIDYEQSLFDESVDPFYSARLETGI